MFGKRNIEHLTKKTPAKRFLGQDPGPDPRRKYFDSCDWVLSKAGKSDSIDTANVGSEHPVPEKIPHLSSPVGTVQQHHHHSSLHGGQASSPVKETSFLSQETKPEDLDTSHDEAAVKQQKHAGAANNGNLPIRN